MRMRLREGDGIFSRHGSGRLSIVIPVNFDSGKAVFRLRNIPMFNMGMFRQYCECRDLEEGLWMPDHKAVVGLSRIKPPEPPKALKPIRPIKQLQPIRPFKTKPITPFTSQR